MLLALGGIMFYSYKVKAQQPTVTLNAADSKTVIEAANQAAAANQRLQTIFELLCRQNNVEHGKYKLMPNPKDSTLVDLAPIEGGAK